MVFRGQIEDWRRGIFAILFRNGDIDFQNAQAKAEKFNFKILSNCSHDSLCRGLACALSESLPRFSMDLVALIFEYRWKPCRPGDFIVAIERGDLVAMQELLSFGADIDEVKSGLGSPGQSGLHSAVCLPVRKQRRIVRFLIENKANVNVSARYTPLQLAIIDNRASICKMLIEAKASTEFVRDFPLPGQSPKMSAVDFALRKGHEPLAKLLRAAPNTWPVLSYPSANHVL